MKTLLLILISLRPKQWIKNGFIFAALIFSLNLFHLEKLVASIVAFCIFCFISGSVYLFNDLFDIEEDRKHSKKCHRPLASGRLSPKIAKIAIFIVLFVSLMVSFLLMNIRFTVIGLGYLAIQIGYSIWLKRIVILDILAIASGFAIRVLAGALAIDVPPSYWLLICTVFVSLFLALGKRRHEFVLLGENAREHRGVLEEYNTSLLDQMISIVTAGTLISYSFFTLAPETVSRFNTKRLALTIPIVLYGIFRYLYLVYRKEEGGSPESMLLEDKPLLATLVIYGIVVAIIIYF